MVAAIVTAVAGLASNITKAASGGAQRKHEAEMAKLEATKYKTFYQSEKSYVNEILLGILAFLVILVVWAIVRKTK